MNRIKNWKVKTVLQREFDKNWQKWDWWYEDELPEMSDLTYEELFPFSEVKDGVRMFPYIMESDGTVIFIGFV